MLFGFAGFGGAGKTTAIQYLEQKGLGARVYLGDAVFEEIQRRGLERTPELERVVRVQLRETRGPSVFADLRRDMIADLITSGVNVFVDAVFSPEEYLVLTRCGQSKTALIGIHTPFELRALRLSLRDHRPHTVDELRSRDETEIRTLRTDSVLEQVSQLIANEGPLDHLHRKLDAAWAQIVGVP